MIRGKGYGQATRPQANAAADAAEFVKRCKSLLLNLQDLPDAADDFADAATSTVLGMMKQAEGGKVTPRMESALDNTERAVSRWEERS